MNQTEAHDYLAETVASYIEGGHPIQFLTGAMRTLAGSRPEQHHVGQLRQALIALGFTRAAGKLAVYASPTADGE